MTRVFLTLSPMFLLFGCSVSAGPQHQIDVVSVHTLNKTLSETSGLLCGANNAYTINDSGNEPELYEIDSSGNLINTSVLDAENRDWEAITGDDKFLYIGDFGNNAGKRDKLSIYKVARESGEVTGQLSISYEGNVPHSNTPYAHDYDGEAMTMRDGNILIFSKSWETEISHVYQVDTQQGEQVLTSTAEIAGLPGVVTGADWNESKQELVLVGYRSNALGMFKPFIATLDGDYKTKDVRELPQFGQVEGVCYATDNHVWISQESTPYTSAKLAVLNLN